MNIGDYVIIKNDPFPIIYIIIDIQDDNVSLKGYTHRIYIKKKIDEIIAAPNNIIEKEEQTNNKYKKTLIKTKVRVKKPIFGRILHIDGDKEYLESCMNLYKEIGIPAEGIYINEKEIPDKIEKLILHLTPDIIVITGHDIYNGKDIKDIKDINSYENTKYFVETVRKIRKHYSINNVCIIVGACSSLFEALIGAGANFASSPKRISIHTYDPAVIAIKVASTSFNKTIDFTSCLNLIENGKDAFGGIETNGTMRILL